MSELSDVLHVLRNPWGHSEEAIRAVQLKAADLLESAAAPVPAREWIRARDHPPDKGEPIIYAVARTPVDSSARWSVGIAYWTVSQKWNPEHESLHAPSGFTHWMPLPPPPA